jgi:hypothetical protein
MTVVYMWKSTHPVDSLDIAQGPSSVQLTHMTLLSVIRYNFEIICSSLLYRHVECLEVGEVLKGWKHLHWASIQRAEILSSFLYKKVAF